MTNDDGLLREVDEGLAEDRLQKSLTKQLPWLIGGAALVVAGVAGFEFQSSRKEAVAAEAARGYKAAMDAMAAGPVDGEEALKAFAAGAQGGYRALAEMEVASLEARRGAREAALARYRALYADDRVARRIRDLARLRAAYLSMQDGRDAVIADVGALETDEGALGFYAREAIALAALDAGDFAAAQSMFERAILTPGAPEAIRRRAEEFAPIAAAGATGVDVTPPPAGAASVGDFFDAIDVDGGQLGDLLEAVGDARRSEPAPSDDEPSVEGDEHDGHDHGTEAQDASAGAEAPGQDE